MNIRSHSVFVQATRNRHCYRAIGLWLPQYNALDSLARKEACPRIEGSLWGLDAMRLKLAHRGSAAFYFRAPILWQMPFRGGCTVSFRVSSPYSLPRFGWRQIRTLPVFGGLQILGSFSSSIRFRYRKYCEHLNPFRGSKSLNSIELNSSFLFTQCAKSRWNCVGLIL